MAFGPWQYRHDCSPTLINRDGTSWMKSAAGWDSRSIWRLALKNDRLLLRNIRDYGHERFGIGMLRISEYLASRPTLDDTPQVHHCHSICDIPRQTEVVCHHKDSELQLFSKP